MSLQQVQYELSYDDETVDGTVIFRGLDRKLDRHDTACEKVEMWVDDWGDLGKPRSIVVTIERDEEEANGE